ncbi:class C beta-lactamase-related serine hydrolase [Blastococcus sp. CT_GayMR19]|uniref:serine hydrolase domain-containing protein n=1 Tax=Blastococcus sp. CT_GayMR19 TaxID=2559608 RepID=UPI0010744835|nr:serine hydrolase [Blastococcus sp. CT_GayMR19]TFV79439.1 class C beta-lactamase-related serine hydrolase [Blastococcus sp. CT_GayMR19]
MRRGVVVPVLVLVATSVGGCTGSAPAPDPPPAVDLRGEISAHLDGSAMDDVRAVLVIAGDRTVVEEYYGTTANEYRNVFSVTKSVMSTLIGIAIDEGLLALDDTLAELLPAHAGAMTPEVAATTLEQLLTMTGGFLDTSNPSVGAVVFEQADWVAASLGSASRPAGVDFAYSDPGSHLVAAALAQATDRSVLDYAREKLFGPLGVDTDPAAQPSFTPEGLAEYEAADLAWPVDPQGLHTGFGHLKLRPRDMAALGSLYLHGGTVDGRQVVSEDWTLDATSMRVTARGPGDGYGYLWWVGEADGSPAYMAVGYGGQLVEVVPDRDLVVAISTDVGLHATVDATQLIYLVDSVIAPAVTR